MTVQVTDVCSYGARTVSYPEAIKGDAIAYYETICKDPKTLYAQIAKDGEVTEQFFRSRDEGAKT